MKIAAVTDDGKTVSQHFGRARYYAVLTMEGLQVVHQEMIDRSDIILPHNLGHRVRQGLSGQHDCHGSGASAAAWHRRMIQPIQDCQFLLTGGLSWAVRSCLLDANVKPILTDITSINAAVFALLEGSIVDRVELLH